MTSNVDAEQFNLPHKTHLRLEWFHCRQLPGSADFCEDHPAKQNTTTPTSVKISCDVSQDFTDPCGRWVSLENWPKLGPDMSFFRPPEPRLPPS